MPLEPAFSSLWPSVARLWPPRPSVQSSDAPCPGSPTSDRLEPRLRCSSTSVSDATRCAPLGRACPWPRGSRRDSDKQRSDNELGRESPPTARAAPGWSWERRAVSSTRTTSRGSSAWSRRGCSAAWTSACSSSLSAGHCRHEETAGSSSSFCDCRSS